MKQQERKNLTRKVTVRFTPEEYGKVHAHFKATTKRMLSEYIRSVLLHKPVTVYTRSQSFDDFVAEMILLRSELHAIGNNFNQAVKKLHTMDTVSELKAWAVHYETSKQSFMQKTDEIKEKINQLANKWSHA
jgi:hypothetical protein